MGPSERISERPELLFSAGGATRLRGSYPRVACRRNQRLFHDRLPSPLFGGDRRSIGIDRQLREITHHVTPIFYQQRYCGNGTTWSLCPRNARKFQPWHRPIRVI